MRHAPLFCVPAAGGAADCFAALGTCVSTGLQLHVLPARLGGRQDGGSAAAVEACLRAIRAARTPGDVHLLGHLDGGWVALETALRLPAAGSAVASVTLVDSDVPPGHGDAPVENGRGEAFLALLEALERGAERSFGFAPTETGALDEPARRELVSERLRRCGYLVQGMGPGELRAPFPPSLGTGDPPPCPRAGVVRLILLRSSPDEAADLKRWAGQVAAWRRRAPDLVAYFCLGKRETILQPPRVLRLAARLTEAPLVVADGRRLPGHVVAGEWALPGVAHGFVDVPALWAFTPHRAPSALRFADICVKSMDPKETAAERYRRADTSFPGFVVDGMPNPCGRRYRMIDGRRRIYQLMEAGRDRGDFYVFRPDEVVPFTRRVEPPPS
jgi:pimeloyl-ACP methyl ester carboxylesterase